MKTRQYQQAKKVTQESDGRAQLAAAKAGFPPRYIYGPKRLKRGRGMSRKSYFTEINPGDPRYESAPYEMVFLPMPYKSPA